MTMSETANPPLLLIADSHVLPGTDSETEFFQMLSWIGTTSFDVLFLGDNLDLWIASGGRYETAAHRRFLEWCREEKSRRRVMMVEGNHEFYLARHHADCFTVCEETSLRIGDVLFLHGDISQKRFGFHRCFRAFAKNGFGDWVMGWLPFGPAFARVMKCFLSSNGTPTRARLAKPILFVKRRVCGFCREHGVKHVVMGHFHLRFHEELDGGGTMDVVPAWKNAGEIGVLDGDGALSVLSWQEARKKL